MSASHGLLRSHASASLSASLSAPLPHGYLSRKRRSDQALLPAEESKRRRQTDGLETAEALLKPSIVVRPHPPNPLAKPCTLLPLMLLPREHLPLSFLDLAAPHGDLPSGRQFQSHIRILDLEGRLGSDLLIANAHAGGAAFAIERDRSDRSDRSDLYALCRLGSWVDLGQLSRLATAVCRERMPSCTSADIDRTAGQPAALVTAQGHKEQRRRRLAIEELQSIVRRRPMSQLSAEPSTVGEVAGIQAIPADKESQLQTQTESTQMQTETQTTQTQTQTQPPSHLPPPETNTQPSPAAGLLSDQTVPPTADTICQNIRNHYFEALYHSMGSLAYFAKGPLSRARAAFHLDCDSNLEMDDLIDFLKGIVLATALIDKKYRETIPELVARLRMLGDTSDHDGPKRKTSKKTKKIKRGSDGLYTDEEPHICKWWSANKPEVHDEEAVPRPEEVKYAISQLRTRETQLQMILILEILALETMRPAAGDEGESQLPGMGTSACNTPPAKREAAKKRSKHNLPLLIDVHADRLCIWQSTTADDVRAMAESQSRGSGEDGVQRSQHPLKDFCVDIIVPFFSARLPLVCESLNYKLGGPVVAPPSRPKLARVPSIKAAERPPSRARPGTAARRPAPAQSQSSSARSLERVLSSERLRRSVSRGPNDAIAQMRSATAAPIPGLKREMSEPGSLTGISRRGSSVSLSASMSTTSTSLRERPANVLSRSVSDAAMMTHGSTEDPRVRKKALVEAELQEAITALKKPNRGLAGKSVVEAAERRLGGHIRRIKKSGPPKERVQVKATPVSHRFRDVFGGDRHGISSSFDDSDGDYDDDGLLRLPGARAQQLLFAAHAHAGSQKRVAATPLAGRVIQATPARTSVLEAVSETVTKATATVTVTASPTKTKDVVLASSPLQERRPRPGLSAGQRQPLFATPTKRVGAEMGIGMGMGIAVEAGTRAEKAEKAEKAGLAMPTAENNPQSLYQQLGWDDDIDDLA